MPHDAHVSKGAAHLRPATLRSRVSLSPFCSWSAHQGTVVLTTIIDDDNDIIDVWYY
jgi:hypothetical protein